MEIKKILQSHKAEIDQQIKDYLDAELAQLDVDERIQRVMRHAQKCILAGGKRIRPIMMLYGYRAAGGTDAAMLMRAAVGIELIHAFLLMHDDIIDQDDLRHGELTMHAFARRGIQKLYPTYDHEHYGESIAIVVGDLLYSLGNKAIFTSSFAPERIVQALIAQQEIVAHTVIGEMQDVNFETQKQITERDIMAMYEKKTARYTFEGPLRLGMILAGGSSALPEALQIYALSLGRAFQLQDDLLGVFGESAKTGKPVGSDLVEGKMTVLLRYALDQADPETRAILMRYVGEPEIDADGVKIVQDALCAVGAYDYVQAYSQREIITAREALATAGLSADVHTFLDGLAHYLQERDV